MLWFHKSLFTNYAVKFLSFFFFDHLSPLCWHFFPYIGWQKVKIFDYLPPPLVNIICERPLSWKKVWKIKKMYTCVCTMHNKALRYVTFRCKYLADTGSKYFWEVWILHGQTSVKQIFKMHKFFVHFTWIWFVHWL